MPVIVGSQNYNNWLDKKMPLQTTEQILASDTEQHIMLKQISNWVNNPQHNNPDCLN